MDSEQQLLEKLKAAKDEYFRLSAAFDRLNEERSSEPATALAPEAVADAKKQMDDAFARYRRSLDSYAAAVLRSQAYRERIRSADTRLS